MQNVNTKKRFFAGAQNNRIGGRKKKILFVVTQSEMGGAQRYIAEIVKPLSLQGYEVLIASGKGDNGLMSNVKCQMSNQIQMSNVKCQKLKHLKRMPCPVTAMLSIREIYKLLKKEKPGVLFLCSTMAGILGSVAAKIYKMFQVSPKESLRDPTGQAYFRFQVIYRIGGWAFNDPRPWWQKKIILFLEKRTSRFKDKIVVNSDFDLQCALNHKIASGEKLVKLYNGLDPDEIDFLPRQEAKEELTSMIGGETSIGGFASNLQIPSSSFKIVGTIANFYKTKGLKYLIEAIRNFQFSPKQSKLATGQAIFPVPEQVRYGAGNFQSIPNIQLLIIGDGPERKNLERLIERYNLQDKVLLLGRIQEARKYLKAFDVFILPSLKEGFPWVVLEAMAAGVPVIATKVGAVQEIIENNNSGFIIEPGKPEILGKKIQELLNNPELRHKFAQNAREKLKQFSKEKMLAGTKKIMRF